MIKTITTMKRMLFYALLLVATISCNTENGITPNEQGDAETVKGMTQLIDDLLVGTLTPIDCEIMEGEKCVKPWGEGILGAIGAKFHNFGMGNTIVFYNDDTCRMGYASNLYSNCDKLQTDSDNHPGSLYDTWQWSYDVDNRTITIIAEDLAPGKSPQTTIKFLSYKDNIVEIDGELPNSCISPYTYKYKCRIGDATARRTFNITYSYNEEDYPCCAQ